MADWQTGLSGAASGAAAGSAFGPWGTAIGGAVGGLAGLFGGGSDRADDRLDDLDDDNRRMAQRFRSMFDDAQDDTPTDSQFYRQGMAAARDEIDQQATRDDAAAAARGLSGSEFDIAQGAKRIRALAKTQRNLLTRAERDLDRDRGRFLRAWMGQQGNVNSIAMRRAGIDAQQTAQGNQMISGALGNAASIFADYA